MYNILLYISKVDLDNMKTSCPSALQTYGTHLMLFSAGNEMKVNYNPIFVKTMDIFPTNHIVDISPTRKSDSLASWYINPVRVICVHPLANYSLHTTLHRPGRSSVKITNLFINLFWSEVRVKNHYDYVLMCLSRLKCYFAVGVWDSQQELLKSHRK